MNKLNIRLLVLFVAATLIIFINVLYKDYAISRLYSGNIHKTKPAPKMRYILQWTSPKTEPFVFMGIGQDGFKRRNCPYTNCIVTADRKLLSNLTEFDVIMFHGPELFRPQPIKVFPTVRSPHQKYVFASMESSHYYPSCSNKWDGYFNWTWTFRLDSDARWGYLLIKDSNNKVIGPNREMQWMKLEDMKPVDEEFKKTLSTKTNAAVWFVSNCYDKSGRKRYADKLKIELAKYNLTLDIYGKCGNLKCGGYNSDISCDTLIKDKYYFYFSFENSFSEDYVTEKLLRALKFSAVPVVYGHANYTRFMPDGIYLNAREFDPKALAAKMNDLINDPEAYANYFRWRNHYSYHSREEAPADNDYCHFCAMVNDEEKMNELTVIENFREWWDNPDFCLKKNPRKGK